MIAYMIGTRIGNVIATAAAFLALIALILIYYEGLPIGPLARIPYVGPILTNVTGGRVEAERRKAREGYVQEARAIAAEAKLAETQRQLAAGRVALDSYSKLLQEAQAREASSDAEVERKIADYEIILAAKNRSCRLDQSDLDWLRQ